MRNHTSPRKERAPRRPTKRPSDFSDKFARFMWIDMKYRLDPAKGDERTIDQDMDDLGDIQNENRNCNEQLKPYPRTT